MRLNLLDCGIMRKRYTSLIEDQLWRLRQYPDQYLEACKDSTGCMYVLRHRLSNRRKKEMHGEECSEKYPNK